MTLDSWRLSCDLKLPWPIQWVFISTVWVLACEMGSGTCHVHFHSFPFTSPLTPVLFCCSICILAPPHILSCGVYFEKQLLLSREDFGELSRYEQLTPSCPAAVQKRFPLNVRQPVSTEGSPVCVPSYFLIVQ